MSRNIYLVGSLRNPEIPNIAAKLREAGHYVFDDWYAAGERADDTWRDYEMSRGRTYREALKGHAAQHVFAFDKEHLTLADTVVLALPAGKSGHGEVFWAAGWRDAANFLTPNLSTKEAHILLDADYDRWDVMYNFMNGVWDSVDELAAHLGG